MPHRQRRANPRRRRARRKRNLAKRRRSRQSARRRYRRRLRRSISFSRLDRRPSSFSRARPHRQSRHRLRKPGCGGGRRDKFYGNAQCPPAHSRRGAAAAKTRYRGARFASQLRFLFGRERREFGIDSRSRSARGRRNQSVYGIVDRRYGDRRRGALARDFHRRPLPRRRALRRRQNRRRQFGDCARALRRRHSSRARTRKSATHGLVCLPRRGRRGLRARPARACIFCISQPPPSWIYSRPATATSKSPPRPARIICFFATTITRGWECGSNAILQSKPAPTATPCATLCATGESMSPPPTTRRIWPPKKTPLTKKPPPACR